jgi:hypothetical protein
MRKDQLVAILNEYPLSMRLIVTVERQEMLATTVIEMIQKLKPEPEPGRSDVLLTIFGLNDCIVRERTDAFNNASGTLMIKRWLEMDMR